jgi:acetyl-CoA decarbonylase/synthase, CODH/ACS complex subunit gamma
MKGLDPMGLTGLQIQKLLPRTNCKECGSNTCLAFAMKLAAKKADLSECPYASEEAKRTLGAASEPPVRCVELGPERKLKLGGETVLYRHEKTFVHQTALAVNVNDTDPPETADQTLERIRDYALERVGETLRVDAVAVTQTGTDANAFVELCKKAWETARLPLVMRSADPDALESAAEAVKGTGGVLAFATVENERRLRESAVRFGHSLGVSADDCDGLAALTARIRENGFNDLLLHFPSRSLAERFQTNTIARRAALKNQFKPMGYPTLTFIEGRDLLEDTVLAVNEICKYGGLCVLPSFDPAQIAALMTLRLNIFTDPQKPIQVEPGVYEIGEPKPDSPVFVTTNFSLTYFIVSGEIENCGISARLVVPECEGMSVLTAWAAGKFTGNTIGKFIREIKLEDEVAAREIIIPGYVAQISGELEESLPGWKVIVGPQEAADLEGFVKAARIG